VNKNIALFICCGLPENFAQTLKIVFPQELIKKAITKECFGGELRTDRMNFAHKIIADLMKKTAAKEGKSEVLQMPENISKLAECINSI
jgi:menaquinone-dependent protoporphyrinogen oxidase